MSNTSCVVFLFCFSSSMLPVSLDCPFFFYCSSVFSNIYSELRDWRGTMEIYFWQQQKTQNQIEDLRNQTFFNYGLMLYLLLPHLYFIIIFMCLFVWILSSINYIKYTIYLFDITTVELVQSDSWVFRHPVTFNQNLWSKVFLLTKIKPEYSDILYNPTYCPGPLVCRIRLFHCICTCMCIQV